MPVDAPPLLPWPVAGLGGGAVAALAGALLVAGMALIAWLSATAIPLPSVLSFSAQVWLLAHGGALPIGGDQLTLMPLGLTLVCAALSASVGGFAYRQGRLARPDEPAGAAVHWLVIGSAGLVAAGYTAVAAFLSWAVGGSGDRWQPVIGALAVSLTGASVGAMIAAGQRVARLRPRWLRGGINGAAAGGLALTAVAATALAVAVLLAEFRINELEAGLGFDSGGSFVWALVVLAYLPNLLVWTLSWLLGAGFTVGTGSLVAVWGTQVGMLPAVPVFGALPAEGVNSPWLLAWLAAGALAGGVAGLVAAHQARAGLGGTLAASALAGALLGAGYLAWAGLSRGNLGDLRLVDLGPRLIESVAISLPLLALPAVLAGMIAWFSTRSSHARQAE